MLASRDPFVGGGRRCALSSEPPEGPPARVAPDPIERNFAENLRAAAWIFQNEKDGRFKGSILACRAVVVFINLRGGAVELAGPFNEIAEAFEALYHGGNPTLFVKRTEPRKERSRSPERKRSQMLAAACLEVLIKLKSFDNPKQAGAHVARGVGSWPTLAGAKVSATTVRDWRKSQRRQGALKFQRIVDAILAEPNRRAEVDRLLRVGPPGSFK
jgi:hypothetical protein